MKNCIRIFIVLVIAFIFSGYVFAAETISKNKTFMSLVKNEVCEINFGTNNYGNFKKEMVNIDKENKTIDISLTATNKDPGGHKKPITIEDNVAGEVVFLIDVSKSMRDYLVNGVTRKQAVLNAADNLVDKLFSRKNDIKIGVVKFSTVENLDLRGTLDDAIPVLGLTDNQSEVKEKIQKLSNKEEDMGDETNIEAGLRVSQDLFSENTDTKKYIVLFTDGLPNTDTKGHHFYCDDTMNSTITALEDIKSKNINFIFTLIGLTNTEIEPDPKYSFSETQVTYRQLAEYIFGTSTNPKYGPVYYVDDDISEKIKNTILDDLVPETSTEEIDDTETYRLSDIVIKDYFPDNIVNNFDFSILKKPSKGTITEKIDETDKSITWTIPELAPKETITLTYRLTLKDNVDVSILDKDLKTNKDVTIDYKEGDKEQPQVHNDKSPVVKLTTESVPDLVPTPTPTPYTPVQKDTTVAQKPIPQTGAYGWIALGGMGTVGLISSIFWVIKSIKLDKKPQ